MFFIDPLFVKCLFYCLTSYSNSFFHSFILWQRFFRHMCMSAKVPAAVRIAKQALTEEKCVVIGLQSTGEARTEEAVSKYVRMSFIH